MLFNFQEFPGFAAEDFDAFEERKWGSNRFNLERMKTRARMESLGRSLEPRIEEFTSDLNFKTTRDHPHIFNRSRVTHMWLYLDRPEDKRIELTRIVDRELSIRDKVEDSIPEHQVALVGIGIEQSCLTCFFRLHRHAVLDRKNLLSRLADPAEQQHLAVLLGRLGEDFSIFFGDREESLEKLCSEPDILPKHLQGEDDWFLIQSLLPRDVVISLEPDDLVDNLVEKIPTMLDIYRFAAWSRENDHLKLARAIKEEKKQIARRRTGFEEGDNVRVMSGLLSGKEGRVQSLDHKGRVKVQFGHLSMEMDSKLLRKN